MDLKAFSDKINTLALEGRIGVSERIGLFDEGKEVGLNRGGIDKMIDAALKAAKESKAAESETQPNPSYTISIPVPPSTETTPIQPIIIEPTDPIVEEVKKDLSALELEANEVFDSLNEMEIESLDFESDLISVQETLNDAIEKAEEEISAAENNIVVESSDGADESIEESLESILAEIKKESSESQSISFEDAISQQEIEIDEAVEDDNWVPAYEPEPDESESFPEPTQGEHGEVALAEGVIIMIAGILSIATCMTIVGIFAAVAGLFLHRTATKKINEQKSGYYKAQHLNLLKIGIVLAWIGGIISVLIRFIPRFL
ncbi:MAG: hypothetical protein ACI9J3_000747 [Parvicellaceae bacterium]|jgi:hypothetical protein